MINLSDKDFEIDLSKYIEVQKTEVSINSNNGNPQFTNNLLHFK